MLFKNNTPQGSVNLEDNFITVATQILAKKVTKTDTRIRDIQRIFKRFAKEWNLEFRLKNNIRARKNRVLIFAIR